MEADRTGGGDGMAPSRSVRQHHMDAIDANEPVNAADEAHQKKVERRYATLLGELRIEADGD